MSYQYSITPRVLISQKVQDLRYELDLVNAPTAVLKRDAEKHLSVYLDETWEKGFMGFEAVSSIKALEREGLDGIVEKLKASIFRFADPGVYTVTDEYGKVATVTVK